MVEVSSAPVSAQADIGPEVLVVGVVPDRAGDVTGHATVEYRVPLSVLERYEVRRHAPDRATFAVQRAQMWLEREVIR